MGDEHHESLLEKIKDTITTTLGLPPGKFPDGEPKPTPEMDVPRGTLTSDDAEGVPVHGGTGIQVE